MDFLQFFSEIHMVFGDIFAVVSVFGIAAMLLSTFIDEDVSTLDQLGRAGITGFVSATLGQISLFITGSVVDRVGIIFHLPVEAITGLLLVSFGFLFLRAKLKSNFYRYI